MIVKSDVGSNCQKIVTYSTIKVLHQNEHEDKLQGKEVTHFGEVEWWRTLMVECVTVF